MWKRVYVYLKFACLSLEPFINGWYVSFRLGYSCRYTCEGPYDYLRSYPLYSMNGIRRCRLVYIYLDIGSVVYYRSYYGYKKLPCY
jgi:hypothetical protein